MCNWCPLRSRKLEPCFSTWSPQFWVAPVSIRNRFLVLLLKINRWRKDHETRPFATFIDSGWSPVTRFHAFVGFGIKSVIPPYTCERGREWDRRRLRPEEFTGWNLNLAAYSSARSPATWLDYYWTRLQSKSGSLNIPPHSGQSGNSFNGKLYKYFLWPICSTTNWARS